MCVEGGRSPSEGGASVGGVAAKSPAQRLLPSPPQLFFPAALASGPALLKMAADSEVSLGFLPVAVTALGSLPSVVARGFGLFIFCLFFPQPESEVFEITDFTTASEWER